MYSHDSFWHVERLQNIVSLLPTQFPVRWSPTLDNGYGIPLFNFTYPLPYYFGALFIFLGIGPVKTYYILLFLAYFAGGTGMYFLAKNRLIGFAAALLYLLTPYQFLDIFVRGALGEVFALGIIPWVILSYQQISRSGKVEWYSSLPFALLLLSHNFFAYLFAGMMACFTLFIYHHKLKILLSFLISLAISAFFIVPAFFEKSLLLISQTENHQFEAHFVYPQQLVYSPWVYLGSVIGNSQNEMSFQLGIANIMILVVTIIYTLYMIAVRKSPRALILYLAVSIFAIFMTLPQSLWLWYQLPLVSSLQFPWRFLGLVTILVALIYLEFSKLVTPKYSTKLAIFSFLMVIAALVNTRNYFRPVKWMTEPEFLALHYEYVGKNTTAHRDELVPRWAVLERNLPSEALKISGGGEVISVTSSDLGLSFVANSPGTDGSAIYHRNYYPMWHLTVDGQPSEVSPTSTGEITFPLLPGEHRYELKIQSTMVQKIGNLISLISVAGLAIYFYKVRKRRS